MIINCNDGKIYGKPTFQEVIKNIKNGMYSGELMIFDSSLSSFSYSPAGNPIYATQVNNKKRELEELLHTLKEHNPNNVTVSRIIVHPSLERETNRVADDPQRKGHYCLI